jgi:signal transduction histidine kinase
MLSIPGIKGFMRTKDTRREQGSGFSAFFGHQGEAAPHLPTYLLHLAERLDIGLLALLEVEASGRSARLRAVGSNGFSSELVVPTLEGDGVIAGLIRGAAPATGRARLFSREEVFPRDAAWCDLVPMDSEVTYVFIPVSSLPLPETADKLTGPCRGSFVLGAEDPGTDGESVLHLKTMLSTTLIGLALALRGRRYDRRLLGILTNLLKEEGYSIGFADDKGTVCEKTGNGFDRIRAESMEHLRQQLARLAGETDARTPRARDLTMPEMEDLKIWAYPGSAPGPDPSAGVPVVVVKEREFAAQIRNRREKLKLLSRFISSIAHEIKNPLTGIAAGVQYLAKKMQAVMQEDETVDFILSEINRLNRIVDDLYKVAKPPQLVLTQVDLNSIVGRSLMCMSEDITAKRLMVTQNFDKALPEFEADADRIQQIIINVIKNAIEASPQGGTLSIETFTRDSRVGIRVTDQGPGISHEEREKIFEPFYSTKERGSGLGLCISQRIVDEHGGSIRIETPEAGGTSFVIELPIGR